MPDILDTVKAALARHRKHGIIVDHDCPICAEFRDTLGGWLRALVAEVERLRKYVEADKDANCLPTCDEYGHDVDCPYCDAVKHFAQVKADLAALRQRHAEAVEAVAALVRAAYAEGQHDMPDDVHYGRIGKWEDSNIKMDLDVWLAKARLT